MDFETKQDLNELLRRLSIFIVTIEDDSNITDDQYEAIKTLTKNFTLNLKKELFL